MDTALAYFEIFSYPTYFMRISGGIQVSPLRRHSAVIWCVASTIIFIYHYVHIYWYASVYQFIHNNDPVDTFSRLLYFTRSVWTVSIKLYLVWCCCRMNDPAFVSPLAAYMRQFKDIVHQIQTHSTLNDSVGQKRHRRRVWIILTLRLLNAVGLVVTFNMNLWVCFNSPHHCDAGYLTPWLDQINDAIGSLTQSMGVAILPILMSIACMQFAEIVNQLTYSLEKTDLTITSQLMRHVVKLFETQSALVKQMQGCLSFLISFFAISMIATVSLLALHAKELDWYNILWVVNIFGYAALVGFTSSLAEEAVSDQY